jgi:hypothetical protein
MPHACGVDVIVVLVKQSISWNLPFLEWNE